MNKTKLLLSTAVGLAFVVAGPSAMAVGKKHVLGNNAKGATHFSSAQFKSKHGQTPKHTGLKERFLVETWGVTTVALTGGALTADDAATTINCKNQCTVVTLNTAEFLSYYSYNQVGICPMVDGYFTNGSCYFSGAVNPTDLYANRTNQTNYVAGAGTHVVQTYVYTTAPAYMGHYQNDYHVYE